MAGLPLQALSQNCLKTFPKLILEGVSEGHHLRTTLEARRFQDLTFDDFGGRRILNGVLRCHLRSAGGTSGPEGVRSARLGYRL